MDKPTSLRPEPAHLPADQGVDRQGASPMGGIHWPSALQLGFCLLGILIFWGLAALFSLGGFGQTYLQGSPPEQALPSFLLAGGAALCGFLLLPACIYAFRRLAGLPPKPLVRLPAWLRPTLLIFALPVLLLLGHWVYPQGQLAWLILPPVHALAIGLPILWFVHLSIRNLTTNSPQRHWGVFNAGLVLAPAVSFIFEILAALMLILVWSVWVSAQPDLMRELTDLVQRLEQARLSPEEVQLTLEPYLANPAVIFAVLGYFALIVPLVEEFVKPIGVWALANRDLSPADGFVAGVLSGAGFALAESLALASTAGDWALSVSARIGTGAIHILASGLIGWALARAWGQRKFIQLGVTYLLAVLIHGAWNALSIVLILDFLPEGLGNFSLAQWLDIQGALLPYAFALLALAAFIALLGINRALYRRVKKQAIQTNIV